MDRVSRRRMMQVLGAALLAVPLLEACGGGAGAGPAATAAAQAKALANSASSAATASQATASAAAPTTAAATEAAATSAAAAGSSTAAAAAPGGAQTSLSIAVWADSVRTWQKLYAQKWAAQNPNVKLTIVEIPYGNIEQKTLVEIAANSLQDVVFSQCKSLPKLATAGAYLALDSYVNRQGSEGTKDFFQASITDSTVDGKLYALPFELNTGNRDIVFYNKDLLDKYGAATPTDAWTFDQYLQIAKRATDAKNRVWGSDLFPGTYYDFDCYARSNGGEVLSSDGKAFQLATNKQCVQTAQWIYDQRTQDKITPSRQDSQGLAFPAGQIALDFTGIFNLIGYKKSIGDKFKWDVVLAPTAPSGLRGYELFASLWTISGKTKQPDLAWDLLSYLNSPSTQTWSMVNQGQPPTRISVWESKEAASISPIWDRIAQWLKDPKDQGPFPMPYNYKYAELEDKWENVGYSLWYGEDSFQDGLQKLQQACQDICAQPR